MSVDKSDKRRRIRRSMIESLFTTIELGGKEVRAQVTDVSEGGMRLILPDSVDLSPKDSVKILIDDVVPTIRGKIRWVSDDPNLTNQRSIGIQFESLEIRASSHGKFEGELDLPIETPLYHDDLSRFLNILEGIDHKIIDGEIEDLSEAAAVASSWIERTIGPLNVWYVIKESDGERSIQPIVEGGHGAVEDLPKRMEKVSQVADLLGEIKFGDISYQFGDPLVLEFFCDLDGHEDASGKIARAFGTRTKTWSKLIIKNIAIKFVGDELENRIRERTRELEIGLRAANEANLARTEFLSNMSHELRTPLNGILGMAQLLEKTFLGEMNEKQAEYVSDIITSGRHLLSLIEEILDLARVESGKVILSIEEIGLETFLAAAMRDFHAQATKKKIVLELALSPSIAGLKIMADGRLLKQIVINLMSNAIKFTPAGGKTTLSADRNGEQVSIAVTDTGIGIAAGELEKIFERFYQIESTPTGKSPGVGIGLSLCRTFVTLHGGNIKAESAGEGKGSRFSVNLPIKGPPPKENGGEGS